MPGKAPANLAVTLAGMSMPTPLVAAAGTAGYVDELPGVSDPQYLGAITTKSITPEPREGNAPWRIIDLQGATGMLNAIGLANVGLEKFIAEKLPAAARARTNIIVSIAGHSIDDYVRLAHGLHAKPGIAALELNVSCPNTADGLQFGEHPDKLRELLAAVRPAMPGTKMIVKLSPNVGNISAMARVAVDQGADALTLINTVSAMAIDVDTRRPRLSRGSGGMSGPAIHPMAVRMVKEVYRNVAKAAGVPIIGTGGVLHWRDAAELILAGATAIGIGTGLFIDPTCPKRIAQGLSRWVQRGGGASISELVGQVHE